VLCSNGKAIELSWDHNLARDDEKKRVKDQGGLEFGKVHGFLSVTRAFGDCNFKFINEFKALEYKSLIVTPEIMEHIIDPFKDEFIVIGSDGLFDEMQSQQVVDYIIGKYDDTPESITQDLLSTVIDIREKADDITIMLIKLQSHLK